MEYNEAMENATFEVDMMARDYIVEWATAGLHGDLQDHFARAVRYSMQVVSDTRGISYQDLELIYETTLSRGANTATPPSVTPPSGGGFSE